MSVPHKLGPLLPKLSAYSACEWWTRPPDIESSCEYKPSRGDTRGVRAGRGANNFSS
jgi:hypothetical protein